MSRLRHGRVRVANESDARYAWKMAAKHRQSLFVSSRTRNVSQESLDLAIWKWRTEKRA